MNACMCCKRRWKKETLKTAVVLICQLPLLVFIIIHVWCFPAGGLEVVTRQVSSLCNDRWFSFNSRQMLPCFLMTSFLSPKAFRLWGPLAQTGLSRHLCERLEAWTRAKISPDSSLCGGDQTNHVHINGVEMVTNPPLSWYHCDYVSWFVSNIYLLFL